eukprot:scaffold22069_cov122-Isochrysis_galbana.AAC.5
MPAKKARFKPSDMPRGGPPEVLDRSREWSADHSRHSLVTHPSLVIRTVPVCAGVPEGGGQAGVSRGEGRCRPDLAEEDLKRLPTPGGAAPPSPCPPRRPPPAISSAAPSDDPPLSISIPISISPSEISLTDGTSDSEPGGSGETPHAASDAPRAPAGWPARLP